MTNPSQCITIRTNNSIEGMAAIQQCWADLFQGKYTLLQDIQPGSFPVCRYSNYASNETGDYDFTIMMVNQEFHVNMQQLLDQKAMVLYELTSNENDLLECTQKAWQQVWADQQKGVIKRSFSEDYECSIPSEASDDGLAHCILYIAIQHD